MKKLLFFLLFLPVFAFAQIPAVNDTIPPAGQGAAFTPSMTYGFLSGDFISYIKRGTSSKKDFYPSGAYLRRYFYTKNDVDSVAASRSIYTANGTLSGDRVVTLNNNNLDFSQNTANTFLLARFRYSTGIALSVSDPTHVKGFGDFGVSTTGVKLKYQRGSDGVNNMRFVIDNNGMSIVDSVFNKGVLYDKDYSAVGKNYNTWLAEWGAVKSRIDSVNAFNVKITGTQTIAGGKQFTDTLYNSTLWKITPAGAATFANVTAQSFISSSDFKLNFLSSSFQIASDISSGQVELRNNYGGSGIQLMSNSYVKLGNIYGSGGTVTVKGKNIEDSDGKAFLKDGTGLKVTDTTGTAQKVITQQALNYSLPTQIIYPDTITFRPFPIFFNGNKAEVPYVMENEIKYFVATHTPYYCDPKNGNDASDGLSWATAKKNLYNLVVSVSGAKLIYIKPGLYSRQEHGFAKSVSTSKDSLVIIGYGEVKLTASNTPSLYTWSNHSGNAYKATIDSCSGVNDFKYKDANGMYSMYKHASSIQGVIDSAATWYLTSGTLYTHTPDNRAPDDSVRVFNSTSSTFVLKSTNDKAYMYFANIGFYGGAVKPQRTLTSRISQFHLRFNNCQFMFGPYITGGAGSANAYGLYALGVASVYTYRCNAFKNEGDGFHYENAGMIAGQKTDVLELEDNGSYNGNVDKQFNSTGDASNGSSAHEWCRILRVKSVYSWNRGANTSEIRSNQDMLVDCSAFHSTSTGFGGAGRNSDFSANDQTDMYLFNCTSYGSTYSTYADPLTSPTFTKGDIIPKNCRLLSTQVN